VVANLGSVVRVDPVSGVQELVSTGGNFAALAGIAVDDCTGDLFTAEEGVTTVPPVLVRIHPVTGEQSVISRGGLFVQPIGVSFVGGVCAPVPLVGSAMGGTVGVQIGEVTISIHTVAGQPLAAILKALALAIRNHPTLESQGISATVSGLTLQVRGGGPALRTFSSDPGLVLRFNLPPGVPALPAAGLGALAALLAAAGVLVRRFGDRSP
jgi:hypothetical protein